MWGDEFSQFLCGRVVLISQARSSRGIKDYKWGSSVQTMFCLFPKLFQLPAFRSSTSQKGFFPILPVWHRNRSQTVTSSSDPKTSSLSTKIKHRHSTIPKLFFRTNYFNSFTPYNFNRLQKILSTIYNDATQEQEAVFFGGGLKSGISFNQEFNNSRKAYFKTMTMNFYNF